MSYITPCFHGLVLFSIVITSLGEEGGGFCGICISCMRNFSSFSLPLGVGGWLPIVILCTRTVIAYSFALKGKAIQKGKMR